MVRDANQEQALSSRAPTQVNVRLVHTEQGRQIVIDKFADPLDRHVCGWIGGDDLRIQRIMALARHAG